MIILFIINISINIKCDKFNLSSVTVIHLPYLIPITLDLQQKILSLQVTVNFFHFFLNSIQFSFLLAAFCYLLQPVKHTKTNLTGFFLQHQLGAVTFISSFLSTLSCFIYDGHSRIKETNWSRERTVGRASVVLLGIQVGITGMNSQQLSHKH